MSNDNIRAALERLVSAYSQCQGEHEELWPHYLDGPMAAARAALAAAPEGEPSDEDLCELAELFNGDPVLAMRRALELWGRPATPPAPLEGEVGELVEFLLTYGDHVMDEYGDVGDHEQLTRAATLLGQLSAAAPAVVPDGPAVPEGREPASVAADATGPRALSPAAQAIVQAVDDRYELCGPFDDNWQELCIAAALRAVADRVVPEPPDCGPAWHDYTKGAEDRQKSIRFRLLAIAAELEGCND